MDNQFSVLEVKRISRNQVSLSDTGSEYWPLRLGEIASFTGNSSGQPDFLICNSAD